MKRGDTPRAEEIRAEYQRRAAEVAEAVARSEQMERDFLESKVLNSEANEACADSLHKHRAFAAWLIDHHVELFSASETATPERLDLLTLCRPAVKAYLTKAEQSVLAVGKTTYPEHYRAMLEADANRYRDLLDKIDDLMPGPHSPPVVYDPKLGYMVDSKTGVRVNPSTPSAIAAPDVVISSDALVAAHAIRSDVFGRRWGDAETIAKELLRLIDCEGGRIRKP